MRLDVMATPDPAYIGLANPLRAASPATPMRACLRLGVQSGVDHGLDLGRTVTGFPAPSWNNLLAITEKRGLSDTRRRTLGKRPKLQA